MRRSLTARVSRILLAGDGTLLVADDALTEPRPFVELLPADHPLRRAAEAMLSGDPARAESLGVRAREIRTDRGQLAALELSRTVATRPDTLHELLVHDWAHPDRGQSGSIAAEPADDATGLRLPLLLPDVPVFQSGLRELRRRGRMLRELRLVDRGAGPPGAETAGLEQVRTVRLYGWLPDPQPGTAAVGVSVDITELGGVSEDSGRFLDALLSVGPDSVLVLDLPRGELLWSNRRLAGQLGYPVGALSRYSDIRRAVHYDDRPRLDELFDRTRIEPDGAGRSMQLRLRDADGRWRWMKLWLTPWLSGPAGEDSPAVEQLVCTLRDVDESVRAEQRLRWEARHDPLTGLANRRALQETMQRVADDPADPRRHVYFLDLDDFRRVNDALGHSAGDELLRTLSARITVLLQPADLVGRFGGDELVVLSSMPPEVLTERLLAAIRGRTVVAGAEVAVTGSIGVATIATAELPGDVIRRSNDAMYQAKRAGRNTFRIAGPLDRDRAQQRVELEAELRRAVIEGRPELFAAFQPIVNRELVPVAAEALLRWQHPRLGVLLPSEFLDIADSGGLTSDLGALMLRRSVTAAAGWAATGHRLPVTVNVGGRQLGHGRLEPLLTGLLAETGMPPDMLCLEVTEAVLVDGGGPELAELIRLRELGLRIALDDFGTGYSPLTYLKRLPATTLKLDRSFVAGLELPEPAAADIAIARAVLQLAGDLGMDVVAEGIETPRQLDRLTELGYELFQGFWAYPPMPATQLGALLARPDRLSRPTA